MAEANDSPVARDRAARLRAIGHAIRRFREAKDMTQAELGELLKGLLDDGPVPQTTISRWEAGSVSIDYETVRAIELALCLPLGTIAAAAHYVEPGVEPPAEVVQTIYFSDRRDAFRAAKDGDNLGFGVRVSNLLWPDRDVPDQWVEHWVLELLAEVPERSA
jgi:transcriptional regulator with XRE-family HTH domain